MGEDTSTLVNSQTPKNGGRHFKPQDIDPYDPTKIAHITRGETLQTPTFRDWQPSGSFEQIHPTDSCRRRWIPQATTEGISQHILMRFTHGLIQTSTKSSKPSQPNSSPYNHNLLGSECYDWVHKWELTISYSKKDLTKKGKHHNGSLHITVDSIGKRVPMVLIDDGSALNVCPLKTASCLGLSIEDFVPTDQYVRAYDNSRREVLGTITLELTIKPMVKKVDFQVHNIALCFNMLLGWPWIHDTKAVPSSLYQKVRFPHEGAIMTIYGDTLTVPKPIYSIDSEKELLTLDGFEIERLGFEKREEEVEKIPMVTTMW